MDITLLSSYYLKQKAFWLNKFKSTADKIHLRSYDLVEFSTSSTGHRYVSTKIPNDISKRIQDVSRSSDLSVFILLASALGIVAARYLGRKKVNLVCPSFSIVDQSKLLNTFVPFELDLSNQQKSFREVVLGLREELLEIIGNQDYPISRLVGDLGGSLEAEHAFSNIGCSLDTVHNEWSKDMLPVDICFCFQIQGSDLRLTLYFKKIDDSFANRLAMHFTSLLGKVLSNLNCSIDACKQVFIPEIQDSLQRSIDNTYYPDEHLFLNLYRRSVQNNPQNVAVEVGQSCYTYQDIEELSDSYASILMAREIGKGSVVAIMLDHSSELVASLLAALKIGAIFIPVDPSLPINRIKTILNDSCAQAMIVRAGQDMLKNDPDIDIEKIYVSDERISNAGPVAFGERELSDGTYILYTSGTTGKPKGVLINYLGFSNYINWARKCYQKNEALIFPLFTSISFDLTLTSIFLPLACGGTVVVYRQQEFEVPIFKIIEEGRVNAIKLTPSHLKLIIERYRSGGLKMERGKIRSIVVGGEQFPVALAEMSKQLFGEESAIYNEYGPTETVIGCMVHEFSKADSTRVNVPIGKAIDNTLISLLDADGMLVPQGAVGELFIGGAGVGAGYINAVDYTRQKFLPHFSTEDMRMYRTGDLAVQLSDGSLLFLGRQDEQIKLRGYRIEVEEIEKVMMQHPQIKNCVVGLSSDGSSLVGAFVNEGDLTVDQVREYVAAYLPHYMVPEYIRNIDRIPLTTNGKVDKTFLKTLQHDDESDILALPQTQTEIGVGAIWSEVLNLGAVNVDKNFFDIGGNSMTVIYVNNFIRERMNADIPIVDMFKYSTVRTLAEFIDSMAMKTGVEIEPVLETIAEDDPTDLLKKFDS